MPVRIFTIPFSDESQTFPDDLVAQFCVNKRVHKIETKFFTRHGLPYWTVAIHYGQILSEEKVRVSGGHPDEEFGFDDRERVLMIRLKEWRREAAEKEGERGLFRQSGKRVAGIAGRTDQRKLATAALPFFRHS